MIRRVLPLFAVAGLAASAILLVDYLRADPLFCSSGGGCDVVRRSVYARPLGVPLPVFGVLFFAGALGLSLSAARRWLLAWAAAGALGAIAFIAIQAFVLGAFCKYCLVADGSSLALALGAAVTRTGPGVRGQGRLAWIGLAAAAVATPIVMSSTHAPPPAAVADGAAPVIARELAPGVATVVEFVDFECPYCRKLHALLAEARRGFGDRVRVVRKQHPLRSLHPHALTAARAACCAEEAGRGEAMADALMSADAEQLTDEGCAELAASAGIDLESWRACMRSDRPDRKIAEDEADARAAGVGEEAPIFWIGRVKYRGVQPLDVLKRGIERALAGG